MLLAALISSLILCLSENILLILVFLIILPVFIRHEKKHPAPLWDMNLFRQARFSLGNLVAFLSYFANMSFSFLIPFFLDDLWGLPVEKAGLLIMVPAGCMAVAAPLAGVLSDKIGALRLMPVSILIFIAGLLSVLTLNEQAVPWRMACSLFLVGLGMGILNTPNNSEIMTAAGRKHASYASGFVATTRNLAFCLGTAASAGGFSLLRARFTLTLDQTSAYLLSFRMIVAFAVLVAVLSLLVCFYLRKTEARKLSADSDPG
jgi:MFS family permease